MKQNPKERYVAPFTAAVELTPATTLLQASLDPKADITSVFAIEELGITDTDAASAIWY